MAEFLFSNSSELSARAEEVLPTLTLRGLNAELWPWVRMTAPEEFTQLPLEQWPAQTALFKSWILLLGILPMDRHAFYLESVTSGSGFAERSSSVVNAQWNHTRVILPIAGGCRVTDTLRYQSRLALLGYLLRPAYQLVFWWRHRRLRSWFGGHSTA